MKNLHKYDIKKFNFVEIFNNANGKSSGSGFIGVIGSLFCMLVIITLLVIIIITLYSNSPHVPIVIQILQSILLYTFALAGLYAGLLGLRKWRSTVTKDKATIGDDDNDYDDRYGGGYGGYGGYGGGYGGYDGGYGNYGGGQGRPYNEQQGHNEHGRESSDNLEI